LARPVTAPARLPSSTCFADVLQLHGRRGWLTPPLVRIAPGHATVLGHALTVELVAGDDGPGVGEVHRLLSSDLTGRVLVIAGPPGFPDACFGGMLAQAGALQGMRALVVDGLVRDVTAMDGLGIPVWARGPATVSPGGRTHVVAVDAPVEIAGVTVAPGDTVVADADGAVVIGAAIAARVLDDVAEYAAAEAEVEAALVRGCRLVDAYGHKRVGVAAIRARGVP
jgi:4-hydroxy-4-methyl-2-oxoglutarate aldolase